MLCTLEFEYGHGGAIHTHMRNATGHDTDEFEPNALHIELSVTGQDKAGKIVLKGTEYFLKSMSIHTVALHKLANAPVGEGNGEIALLHQAPDSDEYVLLCIPLNLSNQFSLSHDFFQEFIPLFPASAQTFDDRIIQVSKTWSISNILPSQKSFYLYLGSRIFAPDAKDVVHCVVMEHPVSIGAHEWERLKGIYGILEQNPTDEIAIDKGTMLLYNNGFSVPGHKSRGQIEMVCTAEEDGQTEETEPLVAPPPKKSLPDFLSMLGVLILLLWTMLLLKHSAFQKIAGYFPILLFAFCIAVYMLSSTLVFIAVCAVCLIPALVCFVVWFFSPRGRVWLGAIGSFASVVVDALSSPASSTTLVPKCLVVLAVLLCGAIFLLSVLSIVGRPNAPTYIRAGNANDRLCLNNVSYLDSNYQFAVDNCKGMVKLDNYITNPECADAIRSRYQQSRRKKSTKEALLDAIRHTTKTKSIPDGDEYICNRPATRKRLPSILENYEYLGYQYKFCELARDLQIPVQCTGGVKKFDPDDAS